MYFSKKTNGFYDGQLKEVYGESWPDDVIEISDELYNELINGQTIGKMIGVDNNGYPILIDPPPLTSDEVKQQALAKRDSLLSMASEKIAPLQDAVDLDMATDEEVANLKEWKKYRVQLNRIDQQVGFPDSVEWPVMPS